MRVNTWLKVNQLENSRIISNLYFINSTCPNITFAVRMLSHDTSNPYRYIEKELAKLWGIWRVLWIWVPTILVFQLSVIMMWVGTLIWTDQSRPVALLSPLVESPSPRSQRSRHAYRNQLLSRNLWHCRLQVERPSGWGIFYWIADLSPARTHIADLLWLLSSNSITANEIFNDKFMHFRPKHHSIMKLLDSGVITILDVSPLENLADPNQRAFQSFS